jgi:peptidyl-dipeptidase A
MNVEAHERWFGTAHHELGHIYYYLAYARPEVPYLLRTGANRAFHEAVGELARLASQQPPYLSAWAWCPPARPDADALAAVRAMDVDRVPGVRRAAP